MKICIYKKRDYCVLINDKIYKLNKKLLQDILSNDSIEILTIGVNRVTKAKIISELLKYLDNKQFYEKQIQNPNGYLSFGIIIGQSLDVNNIPRNVLLKKIITKSDWDQYVVNNILNKEVKTSIKKINYKK